MRLARWAGLIVVLVLIGLVGWRFLMLQQQVGSLATELTTLKTKLAELEEPPAQKEHVVIFLIKSTPTDFFLVPISRELHGPATPHTALQALLAGPQGDEDLIPSVPPTTRLLGLSIHAGLATVNFSQEIVQDFNGGALIESYLIEAVVNTLTEFPEIERVQFLVEGERIETIGGHILISEPITRSTN